MTTTTTNPYPDVPPPAGAVTVGAWQDAHTPAAERHCEGKSWDVECVGDHAAIGVCISMVQQAEGTVEREIAIDRDDALTSRQARQLAGALTASAHAAHACIDTWLTDFRDDLPMIDVPVLLIHGDADRILPYPNTAKRLPGLIKDLTVVTVKGGPHNIAWTHPDVVNPALLDFLNK